MLMVEPMKRKFDIRCGFEYLDGRSWRSQWNRTGPRFEDTAAYQNKELLKLAFVETRDLETREISRAAYIDGNEYVNFKWQCHAITPSLKGTRKLNSINVGITLVTRSLNATVWIDGTLDVKRS